MKLTIDKQRLINLITFLLIGIIIFTLYELTSNSFLFDYNKNVFIMSWIGNCIFVTYFYLYYYFNKKVFTLYNILVAFMFLFNWGQCFMWSLGIHIEGELGSVNLYSNYSIPTYHQIYNAQYYTLLMMFTFMNGGLLINSISVVNNKSRRNLHVFAEEREILFKVSKILGIIVIPLTFYRIILAIIVRYSYGYLALYYGDNNLAGGILTQVETLFFPVIVGLLLGSNYKKRVRQNVYFVFLLYMVLYLLAGERGSWLYKLVILIFLDHTFHHKINLKKFIKYSFSAVLLLFVVYAIVSLRNQSLDELSLNKIIEAFSLENFPLTSAIFEMGGNLGIVIILLIEGNSIWSGYNTYLAALLGMPATIWLENFGIEFQYLENWFSQEILKINWGSGFSFVGEAYINGGLYFGFVYIFLLGLFVSAVTKLNLTKVNRHNVLLIAFKVTSCNAFITMMRGSSHSSFKAWFIGSIVFIGITKIIADFKRDHLLTRNNI